MKTFNLLEKLQEGRKNIISSPVKLVKTVVRASVASTNLLFDFFAFVILITFYLVDTLVATKILGSKILPYTLSSKIAGVFYKWYTVALKKLNRSTSGTISRLDLIHLAIRNMKVKKTRTLITIGGVSIGIGAIVFLVSLGYGFQRLVVSRVARLEELRQADVLTQPGSKVVINDKTLADVKSFTDVAAVYPLIAVVGRVNYQNSISDMAVYGVTTGYLEKSAVKPVQGKIFDSDQLSYTNDTKVPSNADNKVLGISDKRITAEYAQFIQNIVFDIEPEKWLRVRAAPSRGAKILGYTKRTSGSLAGAEYAGDYYEDSDFGSKVVTQTGSNLGVWIKSKVNIWSLEDGKYSQLMDDNGNQRNVEGYFAYMGIQEQGAVLGDSTDVSLDEAVLASEATSGPLSTASAAVDPINAVKIDPNSDWVDMNLDDNAKIENVRKVVLSNQSNKQAVVNRAMLNVLNIKEDQAVGKTFSASFVIPTYLLSSELQRVESESADYTIVGVTPDDASPIFYVPFADLRSLGIVNFSQFKILASNETALDKIRKQTEALGYSTQSVSDTVAQINTLFGTIRLVLGIMGMIALAVASLGMFNTLTISLLERSREIGLMKAMGMTTEEVQDLFLTESILMGFCAGFGGLFAGVFAGKLLGILLTFLSVFKGQGFIDVSYVPLPFIILIMFLSLLVGLLTGIYPAKRSQKISALDALRYE